MAAKKTSNKLPPFVALTWKLLNSQAYRKLPYSAAKILPYFKGKVQDVPYKDPRRYTTSFEFTFTEAVKLLGMGKTTYSGCIKALMKHGFIDPVKKGYPKNTASEFKLSERWKHYGTSLFNEIIWEHFINK